MKRADQLTPLTAQRGFSLIEAMIAVAITGMIIGGTMQMLGSVQNLSRDVGNRGSSQQQARIALDRITRDMTIAGMGLGQLVPVFPTVEPRDDGGVTLRFNVGSATTFLVDDMPSPRTLPVDDSSKFAVGDTLIVYDDMGSVSEFTVQATTGPGAGKSATIVADRDVAKLFSSTDGTAVARIQRLAYYLATVDGTTTLMRQVGDQAPVPIADEVIDFATVFYDNSDVPAVFTPDTVAKQTRIRVIEVVLEIRTGQDRLDTGERESFVLRTRISPRTLMIS